MDVQPFVAWLAPILSTLAVAAGQLALNAKFKEADEKRDMAREEADERRRKEAEWREAIEAKLDEQDTKINAMLAAQCTQMRSDTIHRAHRYIDDLHAASIDEKQSFFAEWQEYQKLCEAYGITNSFVDNLVNQVMALPDRDPGKKHEKE